MKNRNHIFDLYRFLFALAIFMCHGRAIYGPVNTSISFQHNGWFSGGYLGVEFFFILSGFFMMEKLQSANTTETMPEEEAVRYLVTRIRRLAPHCLLVIIMGLALQLLLVPELSLSHVLLAELPEVLTLSIFWQPMSVTTGVLWYVSALIWAGFLVYSLLLKKRAFATCIFFPLGLLLYCSFAYLKVGHLGIINNKAFWLGGFMRAFFEIGFGCSTYQVFRALKGSSACRGKAVTTALQLLLLILTGYLLWYANTDQRDFIMPFLAAALILITALTCDRVSKLVNQKMCTVLGRLSYPFYLCHSIFFWVAKTIFPGHPFFPVIFCVLAMSLIYSVLENALFQQVSPVVWNNGGEGSTCARNNAFPFYRFLFSVVILIFHARDLFWKIKTPGTFGCGYLAVEFFFMLSGFLLMRHVQTHPASSGTRSSPEKQALRYLSHRFFRMFPIYFLSLLALFLSRRLLSETFFPGKGICDTLPTAFLLQIFGNTGAVNGTLWYVSALLWAGFLVYYLVACHTEFFTKIFFPMGLLLFCGYVSLRVGHIHIVNNLTYFWLCGFLRGFFEVGFGCTLYQIHTSGLLRLSRGMATVLEVVLSAGVIVSMLIRERGQGDFATLLLIAALILVLACGQGILSALLDNRLFRYFGLLSYPFYLFHFPVLRFLYHRYLSGWDFVPAVGCVILATTVVSVIVTALTTYFSGLAFCSKGRDKIKHAGL